MAGADATQIGRAYDTASRLLSLDNSTTSGQYKYGYTYDKVGNRMSMAVTDPGGTRMHVYNYDKIYQITDVNYPVGYEYLATDTTFEYDPTGNRTTVIDAGGATGYVTNALNQYTSVGGVDYTYDTSGNMTFDGAHRYEYDPENRLTTVGRPPHPLSAACDTTLPITTGGDAEWFVQSNEVYYGGTAAQSGAIGGLLEFSCFCTYGTHFGLSPSTGLGAAWIRRGVVRTTLWADYGRAGVRARCQRNALVAPLPRVSG